MPLESLKAQEIDPLLLIPIKSSQKWDLKLDFERALNTSMVYLLDRCQMMTRVDKKEH